MKHATRQTNKNWTKSLVYISNYRFVRWLFHITGICNVEKIESKWKNYSQFNTMNVHFRPAEENIVTWSRATVCTVPVWFLLHSACNNCSWQIHQKSFFFSFSYHREDKIRNALINSQNMNHVNSLGILDDLLLNWLNCWFKVPWFFFLRELFLTSQALSWNWNNSEFDLIDSQKAQE